MCEWESVYVCVHYSFLPIQWWRFNDPSNLFQAVLVSIHLLRCNSARLYGMDSGSLIYIDVDAVRCAWPRDTVRTTPANRNAQNYTHTCICTCALASACFAMVSTNGFHPSLVKWNLLNVNTEQWPKTMNFDALVDRGKFLKHNYTNDSVTCVPIRQPPSLVHTAANSQTLRLHLLKTADIPTL